MNYVMLPNKSKCSVSQHVLGSHGSCSGRGDIQPNKTRFVQRLAFNPIFRMLYVCFFSCTALA